MSFEVEDGSGVLNANAYITPAFMTSYLIDRGRQEESSWDSLGTVSQQAFIIAATDYIEKRWRNRFLGQKQFLGLKLAKTVLTLLQNPIDTNTVVIGSRTYTFNSTLGGADSILIGATIEDSLNNLIFGIVKSIGEGIVYGNGTTIHADVSATVFEGNAIIIQAKKAGISGNNIAVTTTIPLGTFPFSTLRGGVDNNRPQPLSFPRLHLIDPDGVIIIGIPDRLKQAVVEYAIRAVSSILQPDPVTDPTGSIVIEREEIVGPIREKLKFQNGARIANFKPYPAADSLLRDYILPGNTLIRL